MSSHYYLPSNRSPKPKMQVFHVAQPFTQIAAELQGIAAPSFGKVSCHDYECEQYLKGYLLVLPTPSPDLERVRQWLKIGFPDGLRRMAVETINDDSKLVEFRFEAGQPCLRAAEHRWVVRPPTWMHDKNEMRRIMRHDDFKDLMNEEGYKVNRALQRG